MKRLNFIYNYMNSLGTGDREYTLEEVSKILRSVALEKEYRKRDKLYINGNSRDGRKLINERTTNIAKDLFKLNITVDDISFFRKCKSIEAKETKLINSLNDDDRTS